MQRGSRKRDMFNRVGGTLCMRITAVGLELHLTIFLSFCHSVISGSHKDTEVLKHTNKYVILSIQLIGY